MRGRARSGMLVVAAWLALQGGSLEVAWAQEQRMQGEVVDPALYLKEGRHGAGTEEDTVAAADGGQTLAFLEESSGTLYLLLALTPGEDPNDLAYDYVNKPVTVTGTVYERGGLKGLILNSIEDAEVEERVLEPPESTNPDPASPSAN